MCQIVNGGSAEQQTSMRFMSQIEGIGLYHGQLMVNPGVTDVAIISEEYTDRNPRYMRFWCERFEGDTMIASKIHPYKLKDAFECLIEEGVENVEERVIPYQDLLLCIEKNLEYDPTIQEL